MDGDLDGKYNRNSEEKLLSHLDKDNRLSPLLHHWKDQYDSVKMGLQGPKTLNIQRTHLPTAGSQLLKHKSI